MTTAGTVSARFDDRTATGESVVLDEPAAVHVARRPDEVADVLRAAEADARHGGEVAGFVSYEAAAGLDAGLAVTHWPDGHQLAALPLAWFATFRSRRTVARPAGAENPQPVWKIDRTEAEHRAAVEQIRAAIAAGDYYQLNLTARLVGHVPDPDGLYAAASAAQRGAYSALIRTGEFTVVSCSPELFFEWDGHAIRTAPMKGTAPRGRWPAEDLARAATVRRSAKERAENAMIVDLLRNDLSRIARTGTVRVPALFTAERYPTVWQLTSTVEAVTRPDVDLVEVFRALFPSGSVTGAPKHAAMAAIAELERRPRGVYCGAVGRLAPGPQPSARFAVAIRTATRADATGYAEFGTGGGITWPSRAAAEWDELMTKTRVLTPPAQPTALLETLRFDPERGLVNLDLHLQRLAQSADYFGFRFVPARVDEALAQIVAGRRGTPARVRIRLDRRGHAHVDVADYVPAQGVVRLAVASDPVRSDDVLLFHKHADRSRYDAARAARPSADDVVLWNERGEVTETTIANLAVLLDGRWWTPPLDCGLLPGIERGRLVAGGVLTERVITVPELHSASQVAVVNSLRGWRAAQLPAATGPGDVARLAATHDERMPRTDDGWRRDGHGARNARGAPSQQH